MTSKIVKSYSLGSEDWESIKKGSFVMTSGVILSYLGLYVIPFVKELKLEIQVQDSTLTLVPLFVGLLAIIVNIGRKILDGVKEVQ